MTTKRLIILLAVLVCGMSVIFILPKVPNAQPVGVELNLPPLLGDWYGKETAVTEKERLVLGPETEFSRKVYHNDQGDEMYVSIVLAGQDMNTSIHRPERCLPAQGWTIVDIRKVAIPLNDADGNVLNVTRLHNMRPVKTKDGQPFMLYNLNYYWFVGDRDTTASHYWRTYFDIRDRLLRGVNQRWAYVTVSVILNKSNRSEQDTDRLIATFIQSLVPKIHKSVLNYS